jgi:hypothetical protein
MMTTTGNILTGIESSTSASVLSRAASRVKFGRSMASEEGLSMWQTSQEDCPISRSERILANKIDLEPGR